MATVTMGGGAGHRARGRWREKVLLPSQVLSLPAPSVRTTLLTSLSSGSPFSSTFSSHRLLGFIARNMVNSFADLLIIALPTRHQLEKSRDYFIHSCIPSAGVLSNSLWNE